MTATVEPDTAMRVLDPAGGWDRVQVIEHLRDAAARERAAEIDQYALIAAAADVYDWVDNTDEIADVHFGGSPHVLYGERLWQFGADGTPQVAEFVTFEVGPALGIAPARAAILIADVLDLRHRFPRTWSLLLEGRILGWVARKIAQNTRSLGLTAEIADKLDEAIAPYLEGWTARQTLSRVAIIIARLDPDGTETRRKSALADRFVRIDPVESGAAGVRGQVDGPAGLALDQTLDNLAAVLEAGGLDGTRQELRAAALEALADPGYAADLLDGTIAHLNPHTSDTGADAEDEARGATATGDNATSAMAGAGADAKNRAGVENSAGSGAQAGLDGSGRDRRGADTRGVASGRPAGTPPRSPWQIGTLNMDLRLTLADLSNSAGGSSRQLGEIALSQIRELIKRAQKVVITPVLDPLAPQGADGYAIPERIARAVKLRNPTVVFPYSNQASTSKHVHLDHVVPYPEGETHTDNLAPLGVKAHRAKTFGGFRLKTVRPGVFRWLTPTGQQYWVTPHGTYPNDPGTRPPRARPWAPHHIPSLVTANTSTSSQAPPF